MYYLFLDLETTGLDPEKDKIIEIGLAIADNDFNPVDTVNFVIETDDEDWERAPEVVIEMHNLNGLRKLSQSQRGTVNRELAEAEACEWILTSPFFDFTEGNPVMCGNTVHYDRMFLRSQMLQLHNLFHYRNFDVSTIKQAFMNIDPDIPFPKGREIHRAIPDCLESIELMRAFKTFLLECLASRPLPDNVMDELVRRTS